MKLLELHLKGRINKGGSASSVQVGEVDLWRVNEIIAAMSGDRDVLLTLTVEEIEEESAV